MGGLHCPLAHRAPASHLLSCVNAVCFLICLLYQREGRASAPLQGALRRAWRGGPTLRLGLQASRWPRSSQAELMSSLIEYCIELNQAAEPAAPQESLTSPAGGPGSSPPPTQRPQLRRQSSVVSSRIQHLSTIDYVEEGERPLCGTHTRVYTCTHTHVHVRMPREG